MDLCFTVEFNSHNTVSSYNIRDIVHKVLIFVVNLNLSCLLHTVTGNPAIASGIEM